MKLLFRQRFFSWFDSYDIYDEAGNTVYVVKGKLAWGHCFKIFDASGNELGMVKQKMFQLLPKFDLYRDGRCIGCLKKEFSLFKPKFTIDYNGWKVDGKWLELDYDILDASGAKIATISKKLLHMTDTYVIDVNNPDDALCALMIVLSIDADKCSRKD